jgi:hypothetical protein
MYPPFSFEIIQTPRLWSSRNWEGNTLAADVTGFTWRDGRLPDRAQEA